VKVWE